MRHPRAWVCTATFWLVACSAPQKADERPAEVGGSTRCWVGQLTKIDGSGYEVSSVPMLLRIERRPDSHRMVRELALGNPSTVQRDVFFVKDDGSVSFVESDLRASGYEARGSVEGNPWASDAMAFELVLPDQSVRVREWETGGILYGHYRYRDRDGEYGDERFHALFSLDASPCADRMTKARTGVLEPHPSAPDWAGEARTTPETVELRYHWPQNLDATIRARVRRIGTPTGLPGAVDAAYQLRTWPDNDGSRVEVRSRELIAVPQHTLEDEDRWERAKVLVSLFPAVLVDFDGRVARLAEHDDYLETVRSAFLARWAGGKDSKDEEANAYLDANLSPELAVISAQRYWNPLVAFWAGADMKVGEFEEITLTRALWFPGARKPVEVQVPVMYGVEGWVNCRPDDAEPTCVRLVSRYAISEHDVRHGLSDAGKDGRPIRVERHTDQTESVLVSDPATLLPYHYYEERYIDSVSGGSTDRQEVRRRELMDLTFVYGE